MMHGREKSDPAIVATKPTNKAGQPAAEPVEPRAGTEGNAGQQSTCRAQNRAGVSQALDRVRQAARQRKKEPFTALLHHVGIDLLRTAFFALKRDAAPGVDGLTWRDYQAELEPRLRDLHARVHRGAYRALPSRRRYIPKPDGRQRPLAEHDRRDGTGRWPGEARQHAGEGGPAPDGRRRMSANASRAPCCGCCAGRSGAGVARARGHGGRAERLARRLPGRGEGSLKTRPADGRDARDRPSQGQGRRSDHGQRTARGKDRAAGGRPPFGTAESRR